MSFATRETSSAQVYPLRMPPAPEMTAATAITTAVLISACIPAPVSPSRSISEASVGIRRAPATSTMSRKSVSANSFRCGFRKRKISFMSTLFSTPFLFRGCFGRAPRHRKRARPVVLKQPAHPYLLNRCGCGRKFSNKRYSVRPRALRPRSYGRLYTIGRAMSTACLQKIQKILRRRRGLTTAPFSAMIGEDRGAVFRRRRSERSRKK